MSYEEVVLTAFFLTQESEGAPPEEATRAVGKDIKMDLKSSLLAGGRALPSPHQLVWLRGSLQQHSAAWGQDPPTPGHTVLALLMRCVVLWFFLAVSSYHWAMVSRGQGLESLAPRAWHTVSD